MTPALIQKLEQKLSFYGKNNLVEVGAAGDALAPPVVASAGEGNLLNWDVVEDGVVQVEVEGGGGGLLSDGDRGLGDGDGSLLVNVGLGGDLDVDVGLGFDLLVDVGNDTAAIGGNRGGNGLASGRGGEGGVVGRVELSLGGVDLRGVDEELGSRDGDAQDDGENNLEEN